MAREFFHHAAYGFGAGLGAFMAYTAWRCVVDFIYGWEEGRADRRKREEGGE